jgi:hypothetical protein
MYLGGMERLIAIIAAGAGCLGVLILIMGIIWFPATRRQTRERTYVDRHPLRPCGEVARDPRWGQLSAVEGLTAPGPAGQLTAPLSGRPAVWYRVKVTRVMYRTSQTTDRTWVEPVWETDAGAPFALADASGQVAVSASLVDANSTYIRFRSEEILETSVDERNKNREPLGQHLSGLIAAGLVDPERVRFVGDLHRVTVEESIIPPGKHLFVLAVPEPWHGYPVLSPATGAYTAISTHTREVVVGRHPRPGTRGDAPAGCGVALLVGGLVLTLVSVLVAFLAIRH